MKYDTLKRVLMWSAVLFALLTVWNDPAGAGRAATGLIDDLGQFSATVIDKTGAFLRAVIPG